MSDPLKNLSRLICNNRFSRPLKDIVGLVFWTMHIQYNLQFEQGPHSFNIVVIVNCSKLEEVLCILDLSGPSGPSSIGRWVLSGINLA